MAVNDRDPMADSMDDPMADEALLPCGRDAAEVWDRAADPAAVPTEHELTCPHCRAAAADARSLHGLVHRMAAEEPLPPPSLMQKVRAALGDAVVAELRPQDLLELGSPAGPARLSRPAAARVLRHVVDGMPGLRARSCRIEQEVPARAAGARPSVTVTLTVTVRFGVDLESVTARVRQMVAAAAEQSLGIRTSRVDITVVDLWDER